MPGHRVLPGMVLPTIWEKAERQQQQLSRLVTHTVGLYCRNKKFESDFIADVRWPSHLCLALLITVAFEGPEYTLNIIGL